MKWRSVFWVLCDCGTPIKLKGKLYKITIISAILYDTKLGS